MTVEATAAEAKGVTNESLEPRAVVLSLTAKDLAKSIAWYRDVVGFTVDYVMEKDGKPTSAGIHAGASKIFLNQDDGGRGWERVKGEGFAITFDSTQDVDAFAARLRAHGTAITMEPADMPWGVRMVRFLDPDGFRLAMWRPLNG
jgi:uncharacterized glyoxalase superfamily protein PhnB